MRHRSRRRGLPGAFPFGRRAATGRRGVRVGPVVLLELFLLAAAFTAAGGTPTAYGIAGGVALLGVLLATLRVRRRWIVDWLIVWVRYRLRLREGTLAAPPPVVTPHRHRSGALFGVLTRESALDVVLAVDAGPLPLPLLAEALEDHDIRLASARVVVAYRRGVGARQVRVVLRLRPGDCPGAVLARGGGAEGARRALSAAATRLARRLTEQGLRARVLSPDELSGPSPQTPVERWDHCSVGGVPHVGYAFTRWPTDPAAFFAALDELPGDEVVTALLVTPGKHGAQLRGTLRLAGPATSAQAAAAVTGIAQRLGARLVRLDGEHARALAGTVPGGTG